MKEKLFTENEEYTDEAIKISSEFEKANLHIFEKYKNTYSLYELGYIASSAVSTAETFSRMGD